MSSDGGDSIEDDTEWTEGDMTLISSDDASIDVGHLLTYSAVFRDASAFPSDERAIHLTDRDMETAEVIRKYLKILTTGKLEIAGTNNPKSTVTAINTIKFLKKYECTALLAFCTTSLRANVRGDPLGTFMLAAVLDEETLSAAALNLFRSSRWMKLGKLSGRTGALWSSPGFPFVYWSYIPPAYLFAATHAVMIGDENEASIEPQFLKLLQGQEGLKQ